MRQIAVGEFVETLITNGLSQSTQESGMTFWKHMLLGYLILLVPFLAAFAISSFTTWDAFGQVIGSDYWAALVCLFGLFWIALFFVRRQKN